MRGDDLMGLMVMRVKRLLGAWYFKCISRVYEACVESERLGNH